MHPLTVWLALAGSAWAVFTLAADHLPAAHRAEITAWLRRHTIPWPATFVALCDSVFGKPALSSAYVLRVCVASNIAAFLGLCLSGVFYPGTSGGVVLTLLLYAPFLIGAMAVLNWLPGLGALLLLRALLQRAGATPQRNGLGIWVLLLLTTAGWALLAWALGLLVVYTSSTLGLLQGPVTWLSGYVAFAFKSSAGGLSVLSDAVRLQPAIMPSMMFPSFGVWLYTPCFPLIWLGLYRLAGACLRGAVALGLLPILRDTHGLLDLDTRPLHALGAVAVGIISVMYWTAVLWRR